MSTATLMLRIPSDVEDGLGRLAAEVDREPAALAAEAVALYVERELATVDGVRRGLAEARAGCLVSHEDVMAELRAVITGARTPEE